MENIFFQQSFEKLIGKDIEKAQKIILELRSLENLNAWQVLKEILQESREKLLENFKNSNTEKIEDFYAYKQSLIAIDFLLSLPSELINQIELYLTFLTKEG